MTFSNPNISNPTATWTCAGTYVLGVTVGDGLGGSYTVPIHALKVIQKPQGTISISGTTSVPTGGTSQLSVSPSNIVDQFGLPFTGTWLWSDTNGYITSTGLYNAPASAGSDTINLKYSGSTYATTGVTVTGSTIPKVSVVATDNSCKESTSNSTAVYTITRDTVTASAMTVNFNLTGTATLNSDYTIDHTTNVTIPANQASATVTVTRMDDTLIEGGNETVVLTLTSGSGYAIDSTKYTGSVNVIDDDLPTITVATTSGAAEGGASGVYTFTRTGTYQYGSDALTVEFAMTGTATNGGNNADYNTIYGWVVIPAGSNNATVTLTPIDDSLVEGDETATLTILADTPNAGVTTYNVGTPSSATMTISDNDTAPQVPNNVIATPNTGTLGVALTWSEGSTGVTGYNVQRSSDAGAHWSSVATAVPTMSGPTARSSATPATSIRSTPTTRWAPTRRGQLRPTRP